MVARFAVFVVTVGLAACAGPEDDVVEDLCPQPPAVGGPLACLDGVSLLQDAEGGPVSAGLEQCADGRIHRVATVPCETWGATKGDGPSSCVPVCEGDAWCVSRDYELPACEVPTLDEAACEADEALLCDRERSACVPAGCRTDADCGADLLCLLDEIPYCGGSNYRFQCERPADTCRTDADCACPADTVGDHVCEAQGDLWTCAKAPDYGSDGCP